MICYRKRAWTDEELLAEVQRLEVAIERAIYWLEQSEKPFYNAVETLKEMSNDPMHNV